MTRSERQESQIQRNCNLAHVRNDKEGNFEHVRKELTTDSANQTQLKTRSERQRLEMERNLRRCILNELKSKIWNTFGTERKETEMKPKRNTFNFFCLD
jgi:hypothetical protein